jgi:ribosome maturation factor RimP
MGRVRLLAESPADGSARSLRYMVDLEKIRAMAERVATSEGLTLVDVELKGGRGNPLLRVFIDKPAGVSHADCQLVSEQFSAILDVEDSFPGKYLLEVSSPGLDRKLSKPSDFTHFVGRRARLVVREAVENQKVFEGRLAGFENGRVRLDLGERGLQELDLTNIQKAQLVVEL